MDKSTIAQKSALTSVFTLLVGPGSVFRSWDDFPSGWVVEELFPITFAGVLIGNLHPSSVTLTINTNGSNGNPTVNLLGSSQIEVANVSYSNSNVRDLSFSGNKSASTTFNLLNVSFFPVSSTHIYRFSYTTAFLITSTLESSFVRSVNFTVTLNGLSKPVSDSVLIEISHGSV